MNLSSNISYPNAHIFTPSIIHKLISRDKLISREEQYLQDLDLVESAFIKPLCNANPPIMPPHQVDNLIDDIFGNILDLRETIATCSRLCMSGNVRKARSSNG